MLPDNLRQLWRVLGRPFIAASVVVLALWLAWRVVSTPMPEDAGIPFAEWYGNWGGVLIVSFLFLAFLFGFARPRRRGQWRGAGLYTAFVVSLFTEMFGIPLTIFLLSPLLGEPITRFGLYESHLWAYALSRTGLVTVAQGVHIVMAVSVALIGAGVSLLAIGWQQIHRSEGGLATTGIYGILRHPQYLGLILIVIGFLIQWPTLPTLLMAPVLILSYRRLAQEEEQELEVEFAEAYRTYRERVGGFLPNWRWRGGARSPSHV